MACAKRWICLRGNNGWPQKCQKVVTKKCEILAVPCGRHKVVWKTHYPRLPNTAWQKMILTWWPLIKEAILSDTVDVWRGKVVKEWSKDGWADVAKADDKADDKDETKDGVKDIAEDDCRSHLLLHCTHPFGSGCQVKIITKMTIIIMTTSQIITMINMVFL